MCGCIDKVVNVYACKNGTVNRGPGVCECMGVGSYVMFAYVYKDGRVSGWIVYVLRWVSKCV